MDPDADVDTDARRRWALALFAFAALTGLLLQTRGALLPSFQSTFGVSESQLGIIAPLTSAASFLTVLVVGLRAGDVPFERALLLSLGGAAVCLALIWTVPSFALLVVALVGATAAVGVGRAVDRPVLSHLYPAERSRVFSLYEMSWAVGATTGPLVATAALFVEEWRLTYVVAAACFGLLALTVTRLDLPDERSRERPFELSGLPQLLSEPTVRTMSLALVLSVAVEAGIFTWLPFYATSFLERSTATLLLSIYLVAYVPGRLTASRVVGRIGPERVLLVSAGGSGVVLVGLLSARTALPAAASSFALGFLISAVFPTVQAWATGAMPEFSGPVNAVASASATLGAMVSPALVGLVADATDITLAMWLLAVFAAGLVVLAFATVVRAPRTPSPG